MRIVHLVDDDKSFRIALARFVVLLGLPGYEGKRTRPRKWDAPH
jgi:hypothetical protein